jgi:hypothetical protein
MRTAGERKIHHGGTKTRRSEGFPEIPSVARDPYSLVEPFVRTVFPFEPFVAIGLPHPLRGMRDFREKPRLRKLF